MSKTRRRPAPAPPPVEDETQVATPWRFQFSLRTMLITTALCSVMAAIWGGLLRAMQDPKDIDVKNMLFYMGLLLGAPVLFMMVVSMINSLRSLLARKRKLTDDS